MNGRRGIGVTESAIIEAVETITTDAGVETVVIAWTTEIAVIKGMLAELVNVNVIGDEIVMAEAGAETVTPTVNDIEAALKPTVAVAGGTPRRATEVTKG